MALLIQGSGFKSPARLGSRKSDISRTSGTPYSSQKEFACSIGFQFI